MRFQATGSRSIRGVILRRFTMIGTPSQRIAITFVAGQSGASATGQVAVHVAWPSPPPALPEPDPNLRSLPSWVELGHTHSIFGQCHAFSVQANGPSSSPSGGWMESEQELSRHNAAGPSPRSSVSARSVGIAAGSTPQRQRWHRWPTVVAAPVHDESYGIHKDRSLTGIGCDRAWQANPWLTPPPRLQRPIRAGSSSSPRLAPVMGSGKESRASATAADIIDGGADRERQPSSQRVGMRSSVVGAVPLRPLPPTSPRTPLHKQRNPASTGGQPFPLDLFAQ
eukprot:COSAG05_NODE_847_length_6998_cov_1.434121_3_plen_282_part_00